ncbi:MAG: YggU family protein [Planctomyces sp.]|nr:YggU family protein [Planctomyces sp.]
MILPEIHQHADGLVLALKVTPKAKKNGITGVHEGQLKVSVTAVPEKGKANTAVVKLLASELKLTRGQLEIIRGETSPQKQVRIGGISADDLAARLRQLLGM